MSDDQPDTEIKSSSECTNRYELIMVAAREARRLNDYYRIRNVEPKSRVTTEAIKRIRVGNVRFAYGEASPSFGDDDEPSAGTGGGGEDAGSARGD